MTDHQFQWFYIADPMCSYCYAFAPEFNQLTQTYPFTTKYIMGGLAPDSKEPMSDDMAEKIKNHWHSIEASTGVYFNHEFWQKNTPVRSTFPACRAVISAEILSPGLGKTMFARIQTAYYQEAKNPSDEATLLSCAEDIGLSKAQFEKTLHSCEADEQLDADLILRQQLNVNGFPSLFLVRHQQAHVVSLGYSSFSKLETRVEDILEHNG